MKTVLLLKNIGAIAMYCLFAVPVVGYFGGDITPWVCIQCLFLGLSRLPERKMLRLLVLLPAFGYIFLCRNSLAELLGILPVYGYLLWQTLGNNSQPELSRQQEWISRGWFVLGIAAMVSLCLSGFRLMFPWALLWLFVSIALLRSLRHDPAVRSQWRYQMWNLLTLGIAPAAAFLLGSKPVLEAMKTPLILLRDWVLIPVAMIVLWLPLLAVEWLIGLFRWKNYGEPEALADLDLEMYYENQVAAFTVTTGMKVLLIGIPLILVILLAIHLLRSIPKGKPSSGAARGYHEESEKILRKPEPKPKHRKSSVISGIRHQYRQYLALCEKKGIRRKFSHTSRDMEALTEPTLGEEVRSVRNLYIRARYGAAATKSDLRKLRRVVGTLKHGGEGYGR